MLSDRDIRRAMVHKEIVIDPWPQDSQIQPASVDVHLHNTFIDQAGWNTSIEWEQYNLHPGQFILGAITEIVTLSPHYVCRIEGKSGLGRKGLGVHITAGFVDPGWSGRLTIEMYNFSSIPITLIPGMLIAQLAFDRLDTPAMRPYGHRDLGSHYQDSTEVVASYIKEEQHG